MPPGKGGYKQINKALNICAFEDYLDGQQATLPPIQDVEQISPCVLRILGQNPGKVRTPPEEIDLIILNILSVYTPRNEYIHRRNRLRASHRRHWPGHPRLGRPYREYPARGELLSITCSLNALARGPHGWCSSITQTIS